MLRNLMNPLLLAAAWLMLFAAPAWADPDQTVRSADAVLHEIMVIPARQIPQALLADAQAVAIIPDVLKIGFVAGVRRGHGVVLIRNEQGQWSLPQFVTLTGGSVGWQAGVQGTDVVLVFMTKKSVEGLARGKFTIGADASAAAGPVGRNAAAATDFKLKAEILSYSRSRGLFVGLALDGSAIDVDPVLQTTYYGAAPGQPPQRIPEAAMALLNDVAQLTPAVALPANQAPTPVAAPASAGPTLAAPHDRATTLRDLSRKNATQLYALVDESWRKYLAVPKEVLEGENAPRLEALQASVTQFERVMGEPKYQTLTGRPEFQATHEALLEYARELSQVSTAREQLSLPPPPGR